MRAWGYKARRQIKYVKRVYLFQEFLPIRGSCFLTFSMLNGTLYQGLGYTVLKMRCLPFSAGNRCIRSEAYPIPMGYIKKHQKCQLPRWPGSVASRLTKYTKEVLQNTKEKSGKRIFKFFALKTIL